MANWFYLAGSLCFVIGTVLNMRCLPGDEGDADDEDDTAESWGFVVKDTGWVNGDETPDLEDQ